MEEQVKKHADVAMLYCEDPKNDLAGGFKPRMRTLNKSYKPDIENVTNGWHCVSGPDGTGTYKVQQKDLTKISPNCWMLVGECVGEDQWVSAKYRVGDYLDLNGTTGWPFGPIQYVDMAPYQPGDIDHILQSGSNTNGSGTCWAYKNEMLHIEARLDNDPLGDAYKLDDLEYTWRVSRGPVTVDGLKEREVIIIFKGNGAETAVMTVSIVHTPTGKKVEGDFTIMGQNPSRSDEGRIKAWL